MAKSDEFENKIIETLDEDGNVIQFELLDIVEFENNEYALLLPVEQEDEDDNDEETEVVLMKLSKINEEYVFYAIDDDAEFDRVVDYVQSLEEEYDEDEGDKE